MSDTSERNDGAMANPKWKEWTEPEKLILLEGWARSGLSDEQIAHNMNINPATMYKWKKDLKGNEDPRSKIFKAIKKGKEVADFEVENALKKTAEGFFVEETSEEWGADPDTGEPLLLRITKKRKYIPGNPTAQIFWLKNRNPEMWRDKVEAQLDTSQSIKVTLPDEFEGYGD